jgi:tRNA-Thr(GGU) m(6)t(6)A37 methyltransferase TsaA
MQNKLRFIFISEMQPIPDRRSKLRKISSIINFFSYFCTMIIEPIAFFHSPLTSKFGVPRQSGIVSELPGRIDFVAPYVQPEALRGMEDYDFLWLIWGFSENVDADKHPTVRPPLLGGNERVGVWATRSPFRPNNLGLSSVRIRRVLPDEAAIEVWGADLMDGTPVFDVKPYLPYVDSHPDARGGFTDSHSWQRLQVVMPESMPPDFSDADLAVLRQLLALDPRPHYHDDSRPYAMPFMGYDIRFHVTDGVLTVDDCNRL